MLVLGGDSRVNAAATNRVEAIVETGQVLDGKFRVERIIGQGSMGLVVEATHLALDERVALKFLRPDARSTPDIVARFAREARAAATLKSDHVARTFDVGTHDGMPFIVMEYLEGRDLSQMVADEGPLPIEEAVAYVLEACEALAEAHARGIVHRDIKPDNLFVTRGETTRKQLKILDFGISKDGVARGQMDLAASETTEIMGSPHYMSPEQIRSTRDVDARADLWSLGIVLFELLTGTMPFTGTDVAPLIAQILHEPHLRLRALRPDAPEELERVVDACLAKDASARFATAADLARALRPFAPKHARGLVDRITDIARSSGGISLAPPDSVPPPALVSAPVPVAAPEPPASTGNGRSRATYAIVAGVFLLAIAVAVIGFALRTTTSDVPLARTSTSVIAPTNEVAPTGAARGASTPTVAGDVADAAPALAPRPGTAAATARTTAPRTPAPVIMPPAKPRAAPSAVAPAPVDSEIRRER